MPEQKPSMLYSEPSMAPEYHPMLPGPALESQLRISKRLAEHARDSS